MKKIFTLVLAAGLLLQVSANGSNNCCNALEDFKSRYTANAENATSEPLMIEAVSAVAAPNSTNPKNLKESIRREIVGRITCPSFITDNTEANDVKAIVAVNAQGSVDVYEAYSGNPKAKDYVLQQLQSMKLKTGDNEKFVLVVKFRVE